MPVVSFKRAYLQRLLRFRISDKELQAQVSKMGFGVELSGNEVRLEVTPNRPDLLDCVGFARALKNFMHKAKMLTYSIENNEPALTINIGRKVAAVRPFMSAVAAYGLKLDNDSLSNLINFSEKFCETFGRKRKRIAIGMHDLAKVSGNIEYDAYGDERYVPLNEKKERSFSDVLKNTEQGRDYAYTIENGWNGYPALKDERGVLTFIPILNSDRSKVTTSTKEMLIDISGTSQYMVEKTADLFAATLIDMGAEVRRVKMMNGGRSRMVPMLQKRMITLPLSMAEQEIGVAIGFNSIISLANKMGYEAALLKNSIRFRVPEYRLDVIDEQDVVEDIAIAYGYDYIQPIHLPATQKGELNSLTRMERVLRELMLGLNFSESVNSYLSNDDVNFRRMRIEEKSNYCVRLRNPKTELFTMLRTWLLPSLLKDLGASQHDRMPHRLFEFDMAFSVKDDTPIERYHLAGVSSDPKANFNDMKSVIIAINDSVGFEYKISKHEHGSFIEGRCAKLTIGNNTVGFFGELHPEVLSNFGIEEPTVAFEFDVTNV